MFLSSRVCLRVVRSNFRYLCSQAEYPKASPVMANVVLDYIMPVKDNVILDMTFGSGGHTELILDSDPTVQVLALDRDPTSFNIAQELAKKHPDRLIPLLGKFSDLPSLIEPLGYSKNSIDVMLFDCGCSTLQMDLAERGFSHLVNGPLDMRMDGPESDSITAQEILFAANELDLKNIFKIYGQLPQGKRIAIEILNTRHTSGFVQSTSALVDVLIAQCGLSNQEVRSAFRALRYFINNELNEVNHGLSLAEWYLKSGGKLLTITEDHLIDLIIKNRLAGDEDANFANSALPMRDLSYTGTGEYKTVTKTIPWTKLNKHVIIPDGAKLLMKTSKLRAAVRN